MAGKLVWSDNKPTSQVNGTLSSNKSVVFRNHSHKFILNLWFSNKQPSPVTSGNGQIDIQTLLVLLYQEMTSCKSFMDVHISPD